MNRIYYVNPESGEEVANIFGRAVRKTAYGYRTMSKARQRGAPPPHLALFLLYIY